MSTAKQYSLLFPFATNTTILLFCVNVFISSAASAGSHSQVHILFATVIYQCLQPMLNNVLCYHPSFLHECFFSFCSAGSAGNNSQGQILFASVIYQCLQTMLNKLCHCFILQCYHPSYLHEMFLLLQCWQCWQCWQQQSAKTFNFHKSFNSVYNQFGMNDAQQYSQYSHSSFLQECFYLLCWQCW